MKEIAISVAVWFALFMAYFIGMAGITVGGMPGMITMALLGALIIGGTCWGVYICVCQAIEYAKEDR